MKIIVKESYLTTIANAYLKVAYLIGKPSCGRETIATAADDAINVSIGFKHQQFVIG